MESEIRDENYFIHKFKKYTDDQIEDEITEIVNKIYALFCLFQIENIESFRMETCIINIKINENNKELN